MVSLTEETELTISEIRHSKGQQLNIGPDEVAFNLEDWNLKQDYVAREDGRNILKFDYALVSVNNEKDIIPINVLNGNKTERMDQIVLLYLRAKSIFLQKRYAITSINVTPYENFLSGIFSVPVVRSVILKSQDGYLKITSDGITEIEQNNISSDKQTKNQSAAENSILPADDDKKDTANRRRRDHTRIIHDILSLAKNNGEIGITKIIYKCNLNYRSALRAVNELLEGKLLEIGNSSGAKQKYQITTEGLTLLDDLKKFNFIKI